MPDELKPCPFCGGKAAYDDEIGILCDCGYYRQSSESKEHLFASWNRRAPNPLAKHVESMLRVMDWAARYLRDEGYHDGNELLGRLEDELAITRAALAAERGEK